MPPKIEKLKKMYDFFVLLDEGYWATVAGCQKEAYDPPGPLGKLGNSLNVIRGCHFAYYPDSNKVLVLTG